MERFTNKYNEYAMLALCMALVGLMSACTSLQGQMNSYDGDIRANMKRGKWLSANRIIETAEFKCEPSEFHEVTSWRNREIVQMKVAFAKSLEPTVELAKKCYDNGEITKGDEVRQSLKDKYYGSQDGGNADSFLASKLLFGSGGESGIPEYLGPCLELAWVQMLSDRNLARMTRSFSKHLEMLNEIDIEGGKASIAKLDTIRNGFYVASKWKDKVDLFMEMLADSETRRWAPIDRSSYSLNIKKMETLRNEVAKQYKIKRWNTRVVERKKDYDKVRKLAAEKKYFEAMRILSEHDLLVKPPDLNDAMEFDDQGERAAVASGELGFEIVWQIIDSRSEGVQYHRRKTNGSFYSILVVGREEVDDTNDKRQLREASKKAQMRARSEFVKFLNTKILTQAENRLDHEDGNAEESLFEMTVEKAEAEVSNLVTVSTGLVGKEVVVMLGWRDPSVGAITPAPMCRIEGHDNFTVSPSIGAYL